MGEGLRIAYVKADSVVLNYKLSEDLHDDFTKKQEAYTSEYGTKRQAFEKEAASFQEKVLRTEFAIPRGRVSSYGLIAKHMNKPGAARAVGTALATNLFPIVIPCHRVIRSDGHLGGYQGGLPMKRQLLQMEGVKFYDKNHLSTKTFYYLNKH